MVLTNILSIDVDINFRIHVSIYNGTGRILRISDFCIAISELRVPRSDFRISERLDLPIFGLWFFRLLDFQTSRFLDFRISSRFPDL